MNSATSQFSEREKEVTGLLLQGKSNKQIAQALGISASTVEYHLKNVYKKLQVSSRTEAVLRLGKSIGGSVTSELGKSTVDMNGETADNGIPPVSTRRMSMNKMMAVIGSGLLIIALVVVLGYVNMRTQSTGIAPTSTEIAPTSTEIAPISTGIAPTNVSSLPDLAITSAYVSMVDDHGRCLPYYEFFVTVVNQGNAPAHDVVLVDTNTGQQVDIGTLDGGQSMKMTFVAKAISGADAVIVDPQNVIVESNDHNNSATFWESTPTPPAFCPPVQSGDSTPTPAPLGQLSIPTAPTILPADGCPTETAGLKLLMNAENGYCLLYPADDTVNLPPSMLFPSFIVVNPVSAMGGDKPGDAWVIIRVEAASGRTAAQVADGRIAMVGKGFNITRSEILVNGKQAVVVDGLPGQDSDRYVFIVGNGRLYTFSFTPWDPRADGFTPLIELYSMVIGTFHFLPPTKALPTVTPP